MQDILGQDQRLGAHQRAEVAELANGKSDEGVAVVEVERLADDLQSPLLSRAMFSTVEAWLPSFWIS